MANDTQLVRGVLDALRADDLRHKKTARRTVRNAYGKAACVYCGGGAGTADHIRPRALGGGHTLGNLVPACQPCNLKKRDLDPVVFFRLHPKAARRFVCCAIYADPEHIDAAQAVVDSASKVP
jgi:5-methylcytosine-specific restriction endonuclease McrA